MKICERLSYSAFFQISSNSFYSIYLAIQPNQLDVIMLMLCNYFLNKDAIVQNKID